MGSGGFSVGVPNRFLVGFMWVPGGFQISSGWILGGFWVVSVLVPCGFWVGSRFFFGVLTNILGDV